MCRIRGSRNGGKMFRNLESRSISRRNCESDPSMTWPAESLFPANASRRGVRVESWAHQVESLTTSIFGAFLSNRGAISTSGA